MNTHLNITVFSNFQYPNFQLLLILAFAILIDFGTGIVRAVYSNVSRTSAGYRKTVIKFIQYIGAILCAVLLQNLGLWGNHASIIASFLPDFLIVFITYIEVTSIFENLCAMDNKTKIAKYFYKPMLRILTFQIRNNPIRKGSTTLTKNGKDV